MYFLYSLLLTVGFVLMLPRLAVDALRTRKYVTGLSQRLGKLPQFPASDRPLIWLHCVSVGETEAARTLVQALLKNFPSYRLAISTTTVTGQHVARRLFAEQATVFYFPIDWKWTIRRVMRIVKPSALLIMETELWPNLIRECHRRSIPVALVNGRISVNSFGRYRMIRPFMKRVLANLTSAIMQSEADVERIRELGMPPERSVCSGNLKFDSAGAGNANLVLTSELRERFGFNRDQFVILAASTHEPEEQIVLDAFRQLQQVENGKRLRLVVAPRHPARFEEVANLFDRSGLRWARRSAVAATTDAGSDIVLLDSIGELRSCYALADLAFVGGSLVRHGGQNMLEPAAAGTCVVTGPYTHNFAAIMSALLAEDAIVQLAEGLLSDASGNLARVLRELRQNETRRREISARALAVLARHRGTTERTIQILANVLAPRPSTKGPLPFPAVRVSAAK